MADTTINFKLYLYDGHTRPFNYTHSFDDGAFAPLITEALARGLEFHLSLIADKVFISLSNGETDLVYSSLSDIDVDTLNSELPAFLKLVDEYLHHDALSVSLHPLQAINDDLTPFVPFDTEERD